jgi:hypothetical protein
MSSTSRNKKLPFTCKLQPPPASFSPTLKISSNTETERASEREREREIERWVHGGARQAKKEE